MKTHTKIGAGIAALGIAAGAVLVSAGGAGAAHEGLVVHGDLSGREEVATDATNNRIVGDPNGSGEAYFFSNGPTNICYVVEVDKIEPATAAHIHKGDAGTNGAVVVNLSPPTNGISAGCVDGLAAGLAADITKFNPDDYYVNVHNAEYPGGAVRAQLHP